MPPVLTIRRPTCEIIDRNIWLRGLAIAVSLYIGSAYLLLLRLIDPIRSTPVHLYVSADEQHHPM